MTAKEYLHRADDIRRKIDVRKAMLDEKRASVEYKGINYEPLGSRPAGGNSTEAAYTSVLDFEMRVRDELAILGAQLCEIKDVILMVGDGLQEQILTKRYIEGKMFDVVASEIGYSTRNMFRQYNRALEKISEILIVVSECH